MRWIQSTSSSRLRLKNRFTIQKIACCQKFSLSLSVMLLKNQENYQLISSLNIKFYLHALTAKEHSCQTDLKFILEAAKLTSH